MDIRLISLLIRLVLALLVLNHLITPCMAFRSAGGRGYLSGRNEGKSYKEPAKGNTFQGTSAGIPGQKATRRGLGISAWGIIMVIVTLILAGMGFYYFSMCYPILCRKSRKYDMIELDKV